ncbi:DUF302 domain-containing protein [Chloroflexota bacterium]
MYSYKKQVNVTFEKAVESLKSELEKEGFTVLSEIDMKSKLHEKLNVELENYRIFGACNAKYAHQALQAEREVGLFMPCNLIVYEEKGNVIVSSILPTVTTGLTRNEKLRPVIEQVESILKKVIDSC